LFYQSKTPLKNTKSHFKNLKTKVMKTQNNTLVSKLSKEETVALTNIVDETLALAMNQHKPFTAADLWNIQRRRRSFVQRRFNA
jgi:hypothetical protein